MEQELYGGVMRHELMRVHIETAVGGVYLTGGQARIFVAREEIGELIEGLARLLGGESPEAAVMATWRVAGAILYDSDDGDELSADVELSVTAEDAQEAGWVALEQLRTHYAGADWEAPPHITRLQ